MAALMEVTQADRDRAERIVSARCADWRWPDLDEDKVSEYWLAVEACAAGLAEERLAHSEPRPVAGEVQVLRETLIKMGRMMPGVQLDDRVSSDLLTYLPVELEAALATHSPAPTEAGEVGDPDSPCTDCDDTGVTFQTERPCSCDAVEQFRTASTKQGGAEG